MRVLYHHRTRATDAQRVHIREIVQAFRALGHHVEMVALVDAEREEQDASRESREAIWKRAVKRIPFAYEAVQLGYNLVGLPWLLAKIYAGRIDFIYERYSLLNFCGVLAARLSRRPIVLEVNSPFALEQHQHREIRAIRFSNWTERVISNAATRVIVVSGPLRRIMADNGIRESKLLLMPNGVNLEHLRRADETPALRKRLGLEGKVVIGFAGWFREWHGLEFLIEAFAASGLAARGAALLLIGDGPIAPGLRALAAKLGIGHAVVFTGPVPHEVVPPYLNLMDIAVQPAANAYCCPIKILEYMGIGRAIVAPRQENVSELLGDGQEALLFEPGDSGALVRALSALIENPELRTRLGNQAFQAIERRGLLWVSNAARVIDSLAAQASPGPARNAVCDARPPLDPVSSGNREVSDCAGRS